MRIAHVTDVYLPRLGGLELQVRDLARAQARRGDEVHVLTTTLAGSAGETLAGSAGATLAGATRADDDRSREDDGVLVRRLDTWLSRPVPPYHPWPARALLRALREGEYDVVHADASLVSPLAWTAGRLAARSGLPTAITVHSMWERSVPLMRGAGALLGAGRWPVAWSAVSTVAATSVSRALPSRPRVDVLPNGVDADWWRAGADRVPPGPGGALTVVSVGRMVGRKRPRELLAMALRARELAGGVPLRLVLVGDGPLLPALRRDVRRAGAESFVELPGTLERARIRELHAAAHLYVAPSRLESFGIAALEARCAGLPVLALQEGGVGDFVEDGVEGFLAADDAELERILARLLSHPGQLARVAAHNRAVPSRVSWESALAAADALYERAASLSTSAGRLPARGALGDAA